jgi:hypothetical protein
MAKRGIPPYSEDPLLPYNGSGPGPNNSGNCSTRADIPHSNISDGRGGVRLLGTISDFTFSIAHYYTYPDIGTVRAVVISPTRDHLRWDLGLNTDSQGRPWKDNIVNTPFGQGNTANPWGVDDPFAARMISSGANANGRGTIGTIGGAERNIRSTINFERIQVTGASLSFPVNALTGMFVGSDNPLYYIYTTFRSEIAFFNNVNTMRAFAHGDGTTAFDRFIGGDLNSNGGVFKPGGALANEVGRRTVHTTKRDWLAWNIGLDHNQWIRFLNPVNSFTFSAQQFWLHRNGQDTTFDKNSPQGVLNDRDDIAGAKRAKQFPVTDPAKAAVCAPGSGSRSPCRLWTYPEQEWLTTLNVTTQYWGGNLRPTATFFYDWSGSYLFQPGVDWTFYDPFRVSVRYNFLEGRGNRGLGLQNRKDSVWFELQYLLY